ncbi:hypothetical protein DsansV1_C11g0111331 [Dioscorea sansibarensis]
MPEEIPSRMTCHCQRYQSSSYKHLKFLEAVCLGSLAVVTTSFQTNGAIAVKKGLWKENMQHAV